MFFPTSMASGVMSKVWAIFEKYSTRLIMNKIRLLQDQSILESVERDVPSS